MPYPRVATPSGTVTYSDTSLFDGYALLILALPAGYVSASIRNQIIPQPIGLQVKIRIQSGVYDQAARIYYNADLEPPNSKYVAYYFDNNDVQLGNSALFTVTASPFTIAAPSLTIPTATVLIPSPGGPTLPAVPTTYTYETTTLPDGSRTTFDFPFAPRFVIYNGLLQIPGVGFTSVFNGTDYTVTLSNPAVPITGDSLWEII